jgi:hypothetical protein
MQNTQTRDDVQRPLKKSNPLQSEKDEKLTFRKTRSAPLIEPLEPNTTTNTPPNINPEPQPPLETQKTNLDDEPMKMFFYYPKYLHPEAVTLIAQNLLSEWENE